MQAHFDAFDGPPVEPPVPAVYYQQSAPYIFGGGTELRLTPAPAAGYAFLTWQGALTNAVVPGVIAITGNTEVTAVFTDARILTVETQGNGDVSVTRADGGPLNSQGGGLYALPLDAPINLESNPDSGWGFLYWDLDPSPVVLVESRNNPLPLTMSDDKTVLARFISELHSADTNATLGEEEYVIELSELLRVASLFNMHGYHCEYDFDPPEDADGFRVGVDVSHQDCDPHSSDYNPQDWKINLSELLRVIQFYNFHEVHGQDSYHYCPNADPPTEDLYCAGDPE